ALATTLLAGCILFPDRGSSSGDDNYRPYGDDSYDPNSTTPFPNGTKPDFGKTVRAAEAPPALSGGTLLQLPDGRMFAADPDRDRAYLVDLVSKRVVTIGFAHGDEPGRAAVDAVGRVHLVLRSGGAIATIDTSIGAVVGRRTPCAAPRGIAFDADRARLL